MQYFLEIISMELWVIYSLISCLAVWLFGFFQKIESESKSVNTNGFIIYAHVSMILLPLLMFLIWFSQITVNLELIFYAIVMNFMYIIILKTRLKSLKFLSSSTYFINYRIFSSILLLLFGQILFWEIISPREYLGIFLWFVIFYFLLEKKTKKESDKDLKKWYLFLAAGVGLLSVIWLAQKQFTLWDFDIVSYIFYSWFAGIFSTFMMRKKEETLKEILAVKRKKDILFLVCTSIIFPVWMYCNLQALMAGWDVAVVYKIISYSLFIPIILSVIFYKEKITLNKIFAFILTIASIWLFV